VILGDGGPYPLDGSISEVSAIVQTGHNIVDAQLIDHFTQLKIIAVHGAGYNNVDAKYAASKGIWVSHTPGVIGAPTADIAFAHILNCSRRIPQSDRWIREGKTVENGWSQWMGYSVEKKVIGIFGLGSIGKEVAKRARGFDMNICYHNRRRLAEDEESALNATYLSKDELLAKADYIVVSMPSTPETHHYLGQPEFEKMKKGVIVVNVARGPLVDEAALVENLKSGKVGGAGLDVFEFEPKLHEDLFVLPNVTLTPHIGTATYEARTDMENLCLANVEAVLSGGKPVTPVPECASM